MDDKKRIVLSGEQLAGAKWAVSHGLTEKIYALPEQGACLLRLSSFEVKILAEAMGDHHRRMAKNVDPLRVQDEQ